MSTPYNIEIVERSADKKHYQWMRAVLYNAWGEPVVRFKFKTWK